MLLIFRRIEKQNDKSEFQRTLHLLSEYTLLLLLSLLLLVFLFYDACLWTSALNTTEDSILIQEVLKQISWENITREGYLHSPPHAMLSLKS